MRVIIKKIHSNLKILLIILCTLFIFNESYGAAITNSAAGNWSNPAIWPATTRTGTITSILTSAVVTGVGTNFLTEVTVGATITKAAGGGAGNVIGVVASIESNTQFTLQANAAYAYSGITYKVTGIPLSTDNVEIGGGLAVIVDGGTFYCASLTVTANLVFGTSTNANVPGNIIVNGLVYDNSAVGITTGTDNIINSLTCWGLIVNNKPFDFYNSPTSATNVFINFHDALPDYYTTYAGGQFFNLTIGDGTATSYNSFAIKATTTVYGDITCNYKSKLFQQVGNLTCYGNIVVNTEGTYEVAASYTLSMANTKSITLNGGYLNLYGTGAAARATITGITGTDYYTIIGNETSGIRAKYYTLSNLDCSTAGLTHSGFVDITNNLSYGTFTAGTGSGSYMDLTNANISGSVNLPGCVFNAGPTYNVKRTAGNGSITFSTFSGVLASSTAVGEANDIDNTDPGDFVLWTPQTIYYTRVASGNWSDLTTWSTGGCGGTTAASIPTSVDIVYICPGHTVTVNGTYSCLSLKFHTSNTSSSLIIDSPNSLTIGSDLSINSIAAASTSATISGTGILNVQYVDIGVGNTTPSATPLTTTLTSTISNLVVLGGIYLVSSYNATGPKVNTPNFTLTSGTLSLYGKISTRNINSTNSCTFTVGNSNPILKLYDLTTLYLNIGEIGSSNITLNGTGSTVNYAKIDGGQSMLNYSYKNLTFSNSSGIDIATANITMNGDLITTSGGTVNFGTYTLGGTVNTITNNGTIKTSNTSATPLPTNKTWGGTGTVEYTASGAQTVVQGTYYNLNTSGNNTKSLENAITATNHLTIGSNTTLDVTASNYTITLGGYLINYGTFNKRLGNFIFNKTTGAQYITGTTDFYDLEIAKNSATEVLLNNNITVDRSLNFSSAGFLNLNHNTLTLKNWANGNIPTLETDRYVVLNSGIFIIENIGTGVTAQFPVGLATSNIFFARVDVTNNDATTNFSYSGLYNYVNDLGNGSGGNQITSQAVDLTYNITSTSNNADIKLYWNTNKELSGFGRVSCRGVHHNGTDWEYVGNKEEAVNLSGDIYYINITGLTSFSPYGIQNDPINLPIELIYIEATSRQIGVLIEWETASEENNNYFTLYRSNDGINFSPITTIQGAGTSSTNHIYSYFDESIYYETTYYKLAQTDYDGTTTYSQIVSTQSVHSNFEIIKYTNEMPSICTFELLFSEDAISNDITITNMIGAVLYQEIIEKLPYERIDIQLPPGVYTITNKTKNTTHKERFVVK